MTNEEMMAFQMSFDGKIPELEPMFRFAPGVVIYPDGCRERDIWKLSETLVAKKLSYEVRGLTGYEALGPIKSHHGGQDWTLPKGTRFGAYANKAKKIKFAN